ncbi:hypothetical protein [Jiangella mangrovi]|uniref:Uncharacterized protein n=1 Tax=Jiangella mangrovi TaxID=1524084 RepID=A0A7W9LJG5_9ACTN|nr:hypothetical protein [Jiangella mangrovi]MBB5785999.1 hypothetical protein [Jiangella mangrovi]
MRRRDAIITLVVTLVAMAVFVVTTLLVDGRETVLPAPAPTAGEARP